MHLLQNSQNAKKKELPLSSKQVTESLKLYYAIHNHYKYGKAQDKKLCPVCNSNNIKTVSSKEEKERTTFRQPHKKSIPKRNAKKLKSSPTRQINNTASLF